MSVACLVKLGGSLLDQPDLGRRLRAYLDALAAQGMDRLALLVGGGPTTDAVRVLDRIHGLGEAVAHDLALRGLALNAHAVRSLLRGGRIAGRREDVFACWVDRELAILEPWSLLGELEREAGEALLPHTWEATSDSVALVLAAALGVRTLHLLKSVGPAGRLDPGGVHPRDIVDPCFADLWQRWPELGVEVVPFRIGAFCPDQT